MAEFTHFDDQGRSKMVDVGNKATTDRLARAECVVEMNPATLQKIKENQFSKGNVLEVARIAGIMASKRTADLIPLCHTLPISAVNVDFDCSGSGEIRITAAVRVTAQTGVEMEALTVATVAALTIYDMCKAVDREMTINQVRLIEKMGGQSGHFIRSESKAEL